MAAASESSLTQLRAELTGSVFARGEEGYAEETSGFILNAHVDPDYVVAVANEADVVAAVRFAVANELPVSVMSGGHGTYQPITDGVLIRTNRLTEVVVDAEAKRVRIGAGANWRTVLPHFVGTGLAPITGSAPTVGAIGLTIGGGYGPLSRYFGLVSDWARQFRVVTGEGELLVVDEDNHADLFWALRGGKVGLGIITELTLEVPELEIVYGGGIYFDSSRIEQVYRTWVDWTKTLPNNVGTSITIMRFPPLDIFPEPLRGQTVIHLRFSYVDPKASAEELSAAGEQWLEPFRAIGQGLLDNIGILPATGLGVIHNDPDAPLYVWDKGRFLDDIDQDYVTALLEVAGEGKDLPFITVETRYHGGEIYREPGPDTAGATGGRQAPYTFLVIAIPDPSLFTEAAPRALAQLLEAIDPWVHPEQSYHWSSHPYGDELKRLWSPEVAERLDEVRRKYDPKGLFVFGRVPA